MKVLHFYKTYYPDSYGGVQQVIYQLAEGTAEYGVESDVLFLSQSEERYAVPMGHHHIHSSRLNFEVASTGFSWEVIARFRKIAAQADIIHYHFPWPFMDLVHFVSGVKKSVVVSYHSDIVKQKYLLQLYKPLMHLFLRRADAIVAASPAYIEHSSVLKQYREKTHVITYGLDESSYPVADAALLDSWRAKLPERFFLFVGAFRYYKGLHFLLQAAARNGLPVVLVGADGVEAELRQQALDLGLSNIIFTGALSDADKVALLQLCTAFVFPSYLPSEAFGISLLEAAMYSKPMISCEIGTGTTYINIANETGLVVPPANVQALADAMQKLWDSPALCERFGQNARTRFEQQFTSAGMAKSCADLYTNLLTS
ncbi:glycosyltransferase family 4 protein [Ectopseudomonas oleovorans]|uniref:Glycosyltransferase family 4 protein n=2 Tax=Ectopseudomonas oleovorans TaxID=301 RepID=A0AA42QFK4_ECTOL|nr:glycosyltransferase family 4 protein [Pseudomonas oleovorans]MDH1341706.1 glycosyltransferase family 4 protein [Pseudomonas oleovorans]MDH1494120.1 glycosyltransferase family 4 protein [Pseudomonas oleovorans]WGG19454.1 glycosyltransferase family 4 protein [Pseudomonas oleovorans]